MFTGAHLHLLVNHAPIFGSLFALALLIVSYFASPDILRRTALVVLVATAIAGNAADLSGDAAEDAVRRFPGVRHDDIEAHEGMAERAYLLGDALGGLRSERLARTSRDAPRPAGGGPAPLRYTRAIGFSRPQLGSADFRPQLTWLEGLRAHQSF